MLTVTDTPPVVTSVSSVIPARINQTFALSSLFTASDPDGDAVSVYDLVDTGGGGGHWLLDGGPLPANNENLVPATQLLQVTYQSGTGSDTLAVRE
jgi:hypothetical protein